MRVFFAIEFDDSTKEYVKSLQNTVRENSVRGNFSHEDNFHLTLKFIGEVEEEKISKLKHSLDSAVKQVEPFLIKFQRIGFFTRDVKKIVWIGLQNEDKGLDMLYKALESTLLNNGFPKDIRGYSPHITLSRETVFRPGFEEKLGKIEVDPTEIRVNRVSLMESIRENGRLKYRAIYVKEI